ncbi:hypothetical protein PANT_7c00263 [Moesziomyces antarcticus T-34]|uniref:Uncharacterized protein n=1 Tax=Pseudozyma antarctica (strain T-34) TaxID=1151754 RepID=M9MBP3_PSEA3|nr:hypothetical protein PANT_7c00263 [Moesziomyces antarcticus T-34]
MGLQGDAGRLSAAVTVKHSLGDKSDSDVVVAEKCAWAGLDAATASFRADHATTGGPACDGSAPARRDDRDGGDDKRGRRSKQRALTGQDGLHTECTVWSGLSMSSDVLL